MIVHSNKDILKHCILHTHSGTVYTQFLIEGNNQNFYNGSANGIRLYTGQTQYIFKGWYEFKTSRSLNFMAIF